MAIGNGIYFIKVSSLGSFISQPGIIKYDLEALRQGGDRLER